MSTVEDKLTCPSLRWRAGSTATLWFTGSLAKLFLKLGARTEVHGLDEFVKLLDERMDIEKRTSGLLTVSNHLSVVDDPMIWGLLPYRHLRPDNIRWSLGSYDICFKNGSYSILSQYFSLGQTLPTHRKNHSKYGGIFQPTITQCIRLLSAGPFTQPTPPHDQWELRSSSTKGVHNLPDPFTDPTFTYSTTGTDIYPAPSAYGTRRHAWIHIFPEGRVHQHPDRTMRYFKWGVARLILESEPCPTVVPIWHEGADEIMHEERGFPRFLPRLNKKVEVVFGEPVSETVWRGVRERWRKLKEREVQRDHVCQGEEFEYLNDELRYGREARELRMEVAFKVRQELLKLPRARGKAEEDPKAGMWDTYREEGRRREGKMDDDSWVKDM
ncbi:uncharacterized protein PV09_06177 [Verruconis gallopava]|uniref:Tafazzin family protein n=1 Tax=Verruconis gallopava TaxID=253628 RepID=A0A0D2A6Y6_9PEZI|nr:uncharacterized protein PV09_06177 [Verruconis gallopava]KIW02355.1 hypothetical protein PV09_06177 [Verruconis gallopava]